ncbi:MAG: hypothetical protein J6T60_11785 [Bacteroidales bacterium]|nr:hypothetical protein [Bacteroidales bacterium]
MFVGYANHTNRFSNARVATLMIDKLLQKFRRQLEIYNEIIEEKMETKHFEMPVDEVFSIAGRGYVFVGCIKSGVIHLGDEVILNKGVKSFVNAIDKGQELYNSATEGESVGLLLGSITKNDLTDFDNLVVEGIDNERNHCEIAVAGQSPLKGKGIIVKGTISYGAINVGDPVIYAEPTDGIFQTAIVNAIEVGGNSVDTASQGQEVTLNFRGLTMRSKFANVIKR